MGDLGHFLHAVRLTPAGTLQKLQVVNHQNIKPVGALEATRTREIAERLVAHADDALPALRQLFPQITKLIAAHRAGEAGNGGRADPRAGCQLVNRGAGGKA